MKLLCCLITVLSASIFGSTAEAIDWTRQQIYEATKEACTKTSANDAFGHSIKSDQLRIGHFESPKFNELLNDVQRRSTATAFKGFDFFGPQRGIYLYLESPGFKTALSDCYPGDEGMIKFFETSVLRADMRGRVSAGLSIVGVAIGVSETFSLFGQFGVYASYALNFGQVVGWTHGAYKLVQQIRQQSRDIKETCGNAEGEELNNCKKAKFFKQLDTANASLSDKADEVQELRELLKNQAEEDIIRLKERRAHATTPEAEKKIDALITQRQKFLEENNH